MTPLPFLWRHSKHRQVLLFALLPLILLQNVELWQLRTAVYQKASHPDRIEHASVYRELIERHDLLLIEKECFQDTRAKIFTARAFYFMAGRADIPTNYVYTGRKQVEPISFEQLVTEALQSSHSTLFIVSKETYRNSPLARYPIAFEEGSWVTVSVAPPADS